MEAHAPVRTSTSRSRFVHVSLSSSCVECTSTWLHPTCAAPRVSRTRRVPVEGAIGCRRPEGPSLAHPLHASDRRRQHTCRSRTGLTPATSAPGLGASATAALVTAAAPLRCTATRDARRAAAGFLGTTRGRRVPHSHEWQDPCLRERAPRTNHPTCNGRHATHTGATREHARASGRRAGLRRREVVELQLPLLRADRDDRRRGARVRQRFAEQPVSRSQRQHAGPP